MHREFSSSYTAKFVIEKERMYVENANRSANKRYITEENLEPNSKNPLIAAFFRNIGYADQLGSGVRNLFKYSKYYSGQEPKFIEDDKFRIIVPLDDEYSYDFRKLKNDKKENNIVEVPISSGKVPISSEKVPIESTDKYLSRQHREILQYVKVNRKITSHQAELLLQVKQRRARKVLGDMVQMGLLEKQGAYKTTVYIISERELIYA